MNDELYHHGIKGQKWGIRRYQNSDGSLTELGRQRYGTARRTSQERNIFGRPTRKAKAAMEEVREIEGEVIFSQETQNARDRAFQDILDGKSAEQVGRTFVNSLSRYSDSVFNSAETVEDGRRLVQRILANNSHILAEYFETYVGDPQFNITNEGANRAWRQIEGLASRYST